MPITTDINTGTYDDFYKKFQQRFPTEQERHEAALEIADPSVGWLPSAYPINNVLASHWGDTPAQSRQTADFLFRARGAITIEKYAPLLIFSEGSPLDVTDPDKDRLAEDVEIAFGFTRDAEYCLDFRSRRGRSGPGRMGVPPPYLGVDVMLPVSDVRTMVSTTEDRVCRVEQRRGADQKLTVYAGTVTLRADQHHYRRTRKVEEYPVVVGRSACRKVLQALKEKTIGPERSRIPKLNLS
jgi:hypothetical protein